MLKNIIYTGVIATSALLMTGCGGSAFNTSVRVETKPTPTGEILVNQDGSFTIGSIGMGKVVRYNYKHSFGAAATTTKNAGFKYFTIIEPIELVNQFNNRNVTNVQEAYDACDTGDGSFLSNVSTTYLAMGFTEPNCEVAAFSGDRVTAKTKSVRYKFDMHNEPRDTHATFNVEEVLSSELLKDANKEYFVPMERD